MRHLHQTMADEIINAGYGLHQNTVVIHSPALGDNDFDAETCRCQPVFDYTFVQVSGASIESLEHVGYWVGRLEDTHAYYVQGFLQTQTRNQFRYWKRPLILEFTTDGYLENVLFAPFDVEPDSPNFEPLDDLYRRVQTAINQTKESNFIDFDNPRHYMMIFTPLYAFHLMHQKAEFELVTQPRNVSRRIERKTGKKPSPYFEIRVTPNRVIHQSESRGNRVGGKKSPHAVRGHFVTYTDEAPLFGHWTGTLFRKAHVRGGESSMVKHKDYRIVLKDAPHV